MRGDAGGQPQIFLQPEVMCLGPQFECHRTIRAGDDAAHRDHNHIHNEMATID